ncbi:MBL fold metallo-hydrolase [Segetibacter sp.]|jgi:phosphoribosyl 1,2-cyclic phosphodiesterase|uniref:MBL fold metallo-hydrolase n=1 Tax=Segetibacter sp. TaxID=2231182 RepID=UPI00263A20E9|nr:MBL fold metallo-hydrolase [Segetibacter sp.]MCW3081568.1 fold hydrolase [Segetibacter sp.]
MSLFITSLNSGSNGNCYYVGNQNEAILVDVGISCREVEKRLKRLGLNIQKIKAVFVSHEHSDHIKGICTLAKKYEVPVYITAPTLLQCHFNMPEHLVKSFVPDEPILIGELAITAFAKLHDACDPYSFVVEYNKVNVGVFTDIGAPCKNLIKHFKNCHAAFLEANFDEGMLEEGNYPYFLKKRISGGNGHLSNTQALDLFNHHRPAFMTHLILSHLSKNNNCPVLVQKLFDENAKGVEIVVASRFEETPVYNIYGPVNRKLRLAHSSLTSQLAFAFT